MEHPDQKFDNTNLKQPMFPAIFVAVDGDMIVHSEAALNNNSLFSPRVFFDCKMSSSTDCCTGPSPGFGHDGSHTLLASNVHAEPAEPIEKNNRKRKDTFLFRKNCL